MSLDINVATARLTRQMRESERAVADALVAITDLMQTAAQARRDVAADPVATHAAMLRLSKMASGILGVQADAMRAHGMLLDIAVETGATEEPDCPDGVFTRGHFQDNRAVA